MLAGVVDESDLFAFTGYVFRFVQSCITRNEFVFVTMNAFLQGLQEMIEVVGFATIGHRTSFVSSNVTVGKKF